MTIVCGKKYELSNSSDPSKVSALSNNEAMHSESSHAFDVYTNMSTRQTSKTSPITIMSEDLLGNEQEYQAIATDSANYCSRFSFCRKSSISHLLNNEIAAESVPASNHQDDTFKQASGPLEGILPLETSSKASLNSNDWLLSPQHIEHPYPTNSDKEILMEKTGIGFKQLTNWFTNARKRIWMPLMRRRLPLRTSESLNAACTCEVGSCKQLYTWNEMVNTTLSPVSFSSAREQKAKKGWNDNQNLRTIRSFSESTCNLNEYDKKQFRKPEIVPSTSTDVSEPLKAERYRVHSTSLQLSDAEKLEECVTSHLYRSQRFPNRRELVNIAPEVGSGNGHVEDLLEMYSSPDGNRAPCDRKEQDDAAVPYALLNGADRVSRQIDQNQRQHLRLQRGAHSSSYRQNKRISSQKATPNDQIVVPLLQENELLYSSVKDEKSTSLPTSSVTTRLPELRTMSTVLRTNSVSNITLPAHLTRSDSPGLTPHAKRSMNIQDILAYTGHNVKRLRTRSTSAVSTILNLRYEREA
ncbi:unnamed protein product [Albugo candida]|uniref:Homeobox domain-containing protein n=1 Tax=Albugo candida TaxID=65357 RepID=A0A024FTV9_9STRA|nr:unnamed protein product [Albugo candida]|eukprot:CCI10545.1 unnamed protein product [Albugo candida]